MGNICQYIFGSSSSGSQSATERSGLLENKHSSMRQQASRTENGPIQRPTSTTSQQDSAAVPYTARSIANNRTRSFDGSDLSFDKIGLENLDKRLSDISNLFNSLLERFSNLKTGLLQLEQLAKEVCAKSQVRNSQSSTTNDVIVRAFECFAALRAQSANPDIRVANVKVKENAKNWIEAVFDSKSLQYEEISFLNLYNLLSRYAWELRSKVPPLRNTVAMTTLEEETFRRDLLVASLNSESNAFGTNFGRLRRLDERLGEFEKMGVDAGEKLADAGRRLLD